MADHAKHPLKLVQAALAYKTGYDYDQIVDLKEVPNGYEFWAKHVSGLHKVNFIEVNELLDNHITTFKGRYERYITGDSEIPTTDLPEGINESYTSAINVKAMPHIVQTEFFQMLDGDNASYMLDGNVCYVDPTTLSIKTKERLNVMLKH